MRSEQQVLSQLLHFAQQQEHIRAVVMNGSRVNPNAPKDLFCDYDVVYYVTSPRHYLEDQRWISNFGELVMVQQNDFDVDGVEGFIFLMLFTDGVRIDLAFSPLNATAHVAEDSLAVVLLDKDHCITPLPPPSDRGYLTPKPGRKEFDETINEILWCSNNVAKGLWREEMPYVKFMQESIIRVCVLKMMAWYASMLHDWTIDSGKFGKWLEKFLPPEVWQSYVKTYAGAGYEETWESMLETVQLVRQVGLPLAEHLGYDYPIEDDRRLVEYLRRVRALPKDAQAY